jgi:hypothetical protein
MDSPNTEVWAIQQGLRARIVFGVAISQNSSEWYRLAADRWTNAAADLSEHVATHPLLPTALLAAHD